MSIIEDLLFPVMKESPPVGVFEIGLVLGGTVSSGAYTAGALDCLLEVLQAWQEDSPKHNVTIPIVGGASGGAICAGILGLVSKKRFPHITDSYEQLVGSTGPTGNPFWDVWVNQVDGLQFLGSSDIGSDKLPSLLNSQLIDQISKELLRFTQTKSDLDRAYFPTPYRMAASLTNLRGIPYKLSANGFGGWSGASFVAHDDYARFAIGNEADPKQPFEKGGKRPDEFWVDPTLIGLGADYVGFETLLDYAVGSAAFPVGLKARPLKRPGEHYRYRPYVRSKPTGVVIEFPEPDWSQISPEDGEYEFGVVDGGVFNNDPMQLAHQSLAGMAGENPRKPELATRALLMIDPLAAKAQKRDVPDLDLLSVISALLGAVKDGARYLTADLALLADDNVFSRFQLVPVRRDLQKQGEDALTTSWLSAFGGFFCRSFRVHDFLLGRVNMRSYLRTTFILRGDNSLFDGWSDPDRHRWAVDFNGKRVVVGPGADRSKYYLPIIPDVSYNGTGEIAVEPDPKSLPWPHMALNPEDLRDPFNRRIDAVLTKLRQQEFPGFGGWLLSGLIEPKLASLLTDMVIKKCTEELQKSGLWPASG